MALALPALAQNNFKISVQGTLKDPNGLAVDDGQQSITFRLYDQAQGGNVVHEETADVQVRGGVYSYLLGTNAQLEPEDFNGTLFLSLEINGNELFPRTEMTYSPYSLSVSTAQQAIRLTSGTETCSGSVGDIKYSILNPTQFANENGDCWVPMDGRGIAGTKLANNYGWSSVPDMSGLFIRAQEFAGGADYDTDRTSNSSVGEYQADDNKRHSHGHSLGTSGAGGHSHTFTQYSWHRSFKGENGTDAERTIVRGTSGTNISSLNRSTSSVPNHSHSITGSISNSGGDEARPRNRNFYVYIRVD